MSSMQQAEPIIRISDEVRISLERVPIEPEGTAADKHAATIRGLATGAQST